jgi:hypothetical protein
VNISGRVAQYSEFYVANYNMDELLGTENYGELMVALTEVYTALGGLEPVILALIDPRSRNIAIPEPPAKLG